MSTRQIAQEIGVSQPTVVRDLQGDSNESPASENAHYQSPADEGNQNGTPEPRCDSPTPQRTRTRTPSSSSRGVAYCPHCGEMLTREAQPLAQQLAADPGVKPAPESGEIGRGRNRCNKVTPNEDRGNTAAYLVRRLKRDAPEMAQALARGEYPSAPWSRPGRGSGTTGRRRRGSTVLVIVAKRAASCPFVRHCCIESHPVQAGQGRSARGKARDRRLFGSRCAHGELHRHVDARTPQSRRDGLQQSRQLGQQARARVRIRKPGASEQAGGWVWFGHGRCLPGEQRYGRATLPGSSAPSLSRGVVTRAGAPAPARSRQGRAAICR
jgi:hypothetical protein